MFRGNYPWKSLLPEHAKRKRQASVRDCTKSARRRFQTKDVSYLEHHINHSATWDLSQPSSRTTSRVWRGAIWRVHHLRADSVVWLSHTSSVWPWSGTPKVHLYNTFLGSLHHLAPQMKNQRGSMRKKPYREKIVSRMSTCDVTRGVSLVTNNLSRKSLWE